MSTNQIFKKIQHAEVFCNPESLTGVNAGGSAYYYLFSFYKKDWRGDCDTKWFKNSLSQLKSITDLCWGNLDDDEYYYRNTEEC